MGTIPAMLKLGQQVGWSFEEAKGEVWGEKEGRLKGVIVIVGPSFGRVRGMMQSAL